MADSFTFDGVSSATWFARVFPSDTMTQAPARIYDKISVPGRSGALLMDRKAYDNVEIEYDVVISGDADFAKLTQMRNYLASRSGYCRLTDSFDTTHYRMAAYMEPFNMTGDWASKKRARGTITFDCQPQRWLLSGERTTTLTASGTITNPTRFASKPFLSIATTRATASVLGIGSTNITITRTGIIYIDCATGRAYYGATPLDSYISLNTIDFPTLEPGSNSITLGAGISQCIITPRWWEL